MEGLVRHAKKVRLQSESSKTLSLKDLKDRVQSSPRAQSPEHFQREKRKRCLSSTIGQLVVTECDTQEDYKSRQSLGCKFEDLSTSTQTALFQEGMTVDQPLENLHM